MKRAMMQVYVNASKEAAKIYSDAFETPITNIVQDDDGSYIHAEIDLKSCVLSLSESDSSKVTGTTMQYCLQYGEGNEVAIKHAYKVLSDGAVINHPLEPCFYSSLMTDLIDKFGVRWCLFI